MQQINLYQDQFRRQRKTLSAATLLVLLGLALVSLTVLQFLNYLDLAPLQAEKQHLEQQVRDLNAQVAVAEQAAKPRPVDKLLEKEVNLLVRRLQHNQRLLRALHEGAMSNTSGFSEYFVAVANRHVTGTWITRMNIGNGGYRFAFSGKSIRPDLVPVYLENLAEEQVFDDFSFNVLEIERLEKEAPLVNFNIATDNG